MAKKESKMKAIITEVKYLFRRNLGDYEHEEIGLTASLPEGMEASDAIAEMKELAVSSVGAYLVNEKKETSPEPAKAASGKRSKAKPAPEEEEEEVEETEEGTEEENDEEVEEKAPKKPAAKKATSKKSKASPFDRDNDLHKDILGAFLDEEIPKWRKKEKLVKRSRSASKEMEGEDFLDKEGNILESFKEKFLEIME